MATTDSPISPLVADIITASMSIAHDTTSRLIDSLMEQVNVAHAREAAVRAQIQALLDGPYAPSPAAIEGALYPADEFVEHFRTDRHSK